MNIIWTLVMLFFIKHLQNSVLIPWICFFFKVNVHLCRVSNKFQYITVFSYSCDMGILFYFLKYFIYLFLEREGREKERERKINVRETSISCLSYVLQLGTKPTTQACALTRNRTCDLLFCRTKPNQLSHMGQDWVFYFKNEKTEVTSYWAHRWQN